MKAQKRINYYHNRHRSDGALIENQRKRIENQEELLILSDKEENNNNNSKNRRNNNNYNNSTNLNKDNINNKYKNDSNLTEENLRKNSIKDNGNENSFYHNFPDNENYLNLEYSQASNNLTKNLQIFYNSLTKPLTKFSKKEKRNRKMTEKQLEEENLLLTKENIQLEHDINILQKNLNVYNDINNFNFEIPSQNEIEQLFNMNQNLLRENEYYRQYINKIKINKENEKMVNNSLKYKADFLVQNMVGSMKELLHLLENDINVNSNLNTNLSLDNKSYSFIPTENLENFTQSSFSREDIQSKEQYSEFNSEINNNINYNYNDNSRNFKDREINFHSKY